MIPAKSYDNRWMHRPVIDWEKNKKINKKGSVEQRIFSATQQLIALRKKLPVVADHSNLDVDEPAQYSCSWFCSFAGKG